MAGRPKKVRNIERLPEIVKFSPRGKRGRPDIIKIQLDEFEAIRLSDAEGVANKQAALRMGISRQTFERILRKGRHKVSVALVMGKILEIQKTAKKSDIPKP